MSSKTTDDTISPIVFEIVDKWRQVRRPVARKHVRKIDPTDTNYLKWCDLHIVQLRTMYSIVQDIINERYPNNRIQWNHKTMNTLTKLIYYTSR